jgi:hypothetical protein
MTVCRRCGVDGCDGLHETAWEWGYEAGTRASVERVISIISKRGKEVGGAIDLDRTIAAIREDFSK